MATRPDSRPATREAQVLRRLLAAKGIGRRYGLFFVSGEGTFFPNGVEDASGYIIDDQGRVHSFWTGWDEERQDVHFTEWEEVAPESRWLASTEYVQARRAAGLERRSEIENLSDVFHGLKDGVVAQTSATIDAARDLIGSLFRH